MDQFLNWLIGHLTAGTVGSYHVLVLVCVLTALIISRVGLKCEKQMTNIYSSMQPIQIWKCSAVNCSNVSTLIWIFSWSLKQNTCSIYLFIYMCTIQVHAHNNKNVSILLLRLFHILLKGLPLTSHVSVKFYSSLNCFYYLHVCVCACVHM